MVIGGAGAGYDIATGTGLRTAFAVCFVVASALSALTVHHEDLRAAVVMPPLLYVALSLLSAAVEGIGGAGSFASRQLVELVNAIVLGAPVLMSATGMALLVAVVRWRGGRFRS